MLDEADLSKGSLLRPKKQLPNCFLDLKRWSTVLHMVRYANEILHKNEILRFILGLAIPTKT